MILVFKFQFRNNSLAPETGKDKKKKNWSTLHYVKVAVMKS